MINNAKITALTIVIISLLLSSCSRANGNLISADRIEQYNNLEVVLSLNLCNSRDAYDACMYLMVPMHFAFQNNDAEKISLFTNQFSLFTENKAGFDELNTMYKLSWLYFSSQYTKLMCLNDRVNEIPEELYEFINSEILDFWYHYGGSYKVEFNGMEDLLQEILYGDGYSIDKSYKYAICDVEQFILAIMCDMAFCDEYFDQQYSEVHDKAAVWAAKMMHVKVEWQNDGGWLFGVGDMSDHQDYIYAGNDEIVPDLQPIKDPNVVDDTSHFSRTPLFLISWRDAQVNKEDYAYFETLRTGLAIQFKQHVLYYPDDDIPYARVTNYMDGKNGLYRYSYHQEGVGYSSWKLSGCLLNGWWAFLNDEDIFDVFEMMCGQIPFDDNEKSFYTSGVTIRELNPELTGWGGIYYRLYCAAQLSCE